MGLNTALVDLGRRVFEQEQPGAWTEGEPEMDVRHGPWFRCRLTVHEPREQQPQGRYAYSFLAGDAELMFGVRDSEGGFLVDETGAFTAFDADDQIEVQSGDLGTRVWAVNTGVEPIRKKRRVIGYRCGLTRVDEPTVETA